MSALFFLVHSDTVTGLVLKFLFAKLVYSTSDGAVLYLLGFAAVALVCRHAKCSTGTAKIGQALLWGGLALGFGSHFVATMSYFVQHDIPLAAHVYHWSGGNNSYSSLLHSHLGKATLSPLTMLFPAAAHYDTGVALAATTPFPLVWLIGCSFLAANIGAMLRMPAFFSIHGHRPARIAAGLIAASTVIKSIFDGGLLAYAVLPALVLFGSLMYCRDEHDWKNFWRRHGAAIVIVLMAGYASLWIGMTPGNELPLFGPWLFFIVAMAVLSIWSWRGSAAWLLRLIMLAYLLVNCLFDYGDNLEPLLRKPSADYRIVRFDNEGNWIRYATDRFMEQPVFLIYRSLGDDPWKPRNVLIWRDSAQGSRNLGVSIQLMGWHAEQGSLSPTPSLHIAKIAAERNGWISLDIATNTLLLPPIVAFGIGSALSRNNYYVWLYQIDLLMRKGGWRSYALLPHTVGNVQAHAGME